MHYSPTIDQIHAADCQMRAIAKRFNGGKDTFHFWSFQKAFTDRKGKTFAKYKIGSGVATTRQLKKAGLPKYLVFRLFYWKS